mgnify:CR=1 FL=1
MSQPTDPPVAVLRPHSVARALRHPIRRAALAVALEAESPMPVVELVATVAERGAEYGVDADLERSELREALHHRHLPVLVMADLLERRAGDAVALGDHRLLAHPRVTPAWLRTEGANWAALGAVFGQPRRRVAVRLLSGAALPIGLDPLARGVAAEVRSDLCADAPLVEDVRLRLHHVGLPLLDDADVLRYDADASRVVSLSPLQVPLPVAGL